MMPASPGTLFEVIESEFVLEFLAGVLNPPATLRKPDEFLSGCRGRQVREEELRRLFDIDRPFGDQPARLKRFNAHPCVMGMTDPPDGEAARHRTSAALSPRHLAEGGTPPPCPVSNTPGLQRAVCEFLRPRRRSAHRPLHRHRPQIGVRRNHPQRAVDAQAPRQSTTGSIQ